MDNKIAVLDKGYVRLVDVLGSDLTVVNAARVSFEKESKQFSDKDGKLIKFLAENGHLSPFRHPKLQFEIRAPLLVARQHWKYVVDSQWFDENEATSWNESSRRYVTEECEFYFPSEWRSQAENKKQGSGNSVNLSLTLQADEKLRIAQKKGIENYEWALENGICAEQARLFLPAYGLYIRYYWTASLQAVGHFLNQRLAHDAQKEIQLYAKAVKFLTEGKFPISLPYLLNGK